MFTLRVIILLVVLDEGGEHFKDSLELAGSRERLVEPSVIYRSPASVIRVQIKDLPALAPVLIMATSCFVEMCCLCLREGVVLMP